ncbi:MAG: DMT family transporter [Rhizobiales bacterium]|nr:DMT family transporter [Hyphomicrobiales bacterium]
MRPTARSEIADVGGADISPSARKAERGDEWLRRLTGRFGTAHVGIGLMVASGGALVVGDATAKWLAATYPVGEIISVRGFIIMALLAALHIRAPEQLLPRRLGPQVLRALFFTGATFLMIWSVKLLPLATVSSIVFAAPLIMTMLAPALLHERVGLHRWIATIVGFLGVAIIIDPRSGGDALVMLVPVGAALFAALRDLSTRYIARGESAAAVIFVSIAFTAIAGLATLPFGWVIPTPFDGLLFLFLAGVYCLAYAMQVFAFRVAEAGLLAPFKYTQLVWATVIGFLVFGHMPAAAVFVGAAIVIASGIYVWRTETRTLPATS